jgi:hypothetical protein
MAYSDEDLRDAQVEKLHAEIRATGKRPWQSHTYWIAIFTAVAAMSSTVWQFFRSDTEYKLAELKRLQAELSEREIGQRVIALKSQEEELQKNRDALTAEIGARNAELSTLSAKVASLQTELQGRTAELKTQVNLNARLQQEVLKGLKTEAATLAQQLIDEAGKRGIDARIISGYRSPEDQEKLVERGFVKAKRSVHNIGLAFDIGIFKDGAYVGDDAAYDTVGQIGKDLGLIWGGDWKGIKDKPHFETRNAKQVLAGEKT